MEGENSTETFIKIKRTWEAKIKKVGNNFDKLVDLYIEARNLEEKQKKDIQNLIIHRAVSLRFVPDGEYINEDSPDYDKLTEEGKLGKNVKSWNAVKEEVEKEIEEAIKEQ